MKPSAENGFLAEVQALRQQIASNHGQREDWCYCASRGADGPALRKLHAYMSGIFGDHRQARLNAISVLIGRQLETTEARDRVPGLTIGEVYALLSWLDNGWDMDPRARAEAVLVMLRDQFDRYAGLVRRFLEPVEIPTIGAAYATAQSEMEEVEGAPTHGPSTPYF